MSFVKIYQVVVSILQLSGTLAFKELKKSIIDTLEYFA